jgi:hypothetical protein
MNSKSYYPGVQLKAAPMMSGIVLVGTGALICMAGMIVGGSAVCSATRKWFRAQAVQSPQAVKTKWAKRPKMAVAGAMNGNASGAPAHSGHA